jgi:site-specific DNA recombinase
MASLHPLLWPRDGRKLKIAIVARISTINQDPRSLDDQVAKCRAYIREHYGEQFDVIVIATQGSGEQLDRSELAELEALIESQTIDLVITEELSRICRRTRAYDFCELCEDHGVRLIAINDRVDTSVEGWQDTAYLSTWHHERANRDTSNRIRRSQQNRFDNGGMVQFLPYGYLKPEGVKYDQQVTKDPAAEPIIREVFRRLEEGASYSEVADWLNSHSIPTGPCCRVSRTWDSELVRRLVHNPILKGVRYRNCKVSKRHNKSGRHISVDADPKDLRTRPCPHLAFLEPAYYDHVVRQVDERNRRRHPNRSVTASSRKGMPLKRTRFPGQHALCGLCGRTLWWADTGGTPAMFCSGAHAYHCWNSLTITQGFLTKPVAKAILEELQRQPMFDAVLAAKVRHELDEAGRTRGVRRAEIVAKRDSLQLRQQRLLECIETGQSSPAMLRTCLQT